MQPKIKKALIVTAVVAALVLLNPAGSRAAAFIKEVEEGGQPKLKAYLDPAGVPTIGYGSTWNYDKGRWVQMGDVITKEQAERYLQLHIDEKKKLINDLVRVPLTAGMRDSLISFTYNVGSTAFKTSTLLKRINAGESKYNVSGEFDKWVYVTNPVTGYKVKSTGLYNRRQKEKQLFLS